MYSSFLHTCFSQQNSGQGSDPIRIYPTQSSTKVSVEELGVIKTTYGEIILTKVEPGTLLSKTILIPGPDVQEEAIAKKIFDDEAYIEFIYNRKGEVIDVKVVKLGKLTTFNSYVRSFCEELTTKLDEINSYEIFKRPIGSCFKFIQSVKFVVR